MTATCTRGTVVHSRPFPSFVTSTIEPVSATPKFAPETPRSARRNSARNRSRAKAASGPGAGLEDAVVGHLGLQDARATW